MVLLTALCLAAISISLSITASEGFLIILIIFLLCYLIKNSVDVTADSPYFLPFFFYWIATLLPIFFGSEYVNVGKSFFVIWPLLYFFVAYYFVIKSEGYIVLIFLALGAVALSVTVCVDVLYFHKIRGFGVLKSYMTSGNILALAAVLSIGMIVSGAAKSLVHKIFYTLVFVIVTAGVIYTGTRGAIAAAICALTIMFVVKYKLKGLFISACFIVLMGLAAYYAEVGDRFIELTSGFGDYHTSHGWRLLLWQEAIKIFKEYPIFGIGAGAFESFMFKVMPAAGLPMAHAHNGYLQQLVSFGIVGFICFLLFYCSIFVMQIKHIFDNGIVFTSVFVSIVFFIEAVTENLFLDSEVIMFYTFIAGIAAASARSADKSVSKGRRG